MHRIAARARDRGPARRTGGHDPLDRASDELARLGAVPVAETRGRDGRIITAAGVSSGIDMALTLTARIAGDEARAGDPARHRVRPAAAVRRRVTRRSPSGPSRAHQSIRHGDDATSRFSGPRRRYLTSRDMRRSASTLPPVWHCGQYVDLVRLVAHAPQRLAAARARRSVARVHLEVVAELRLRQPARASAFALEAVAITVADGVEQPRPCVGVERRERRVRRELRRARARRRRSPDRRPRPCAGRAAACARGGGRRRAG